MGIEGAAGAGRENQGYPWWRVLPGLIGVDSCRWCGGVPRGSPMEQANLEAMAVFTHSDSAQRVNVGKPRLAFRDSRQLAARMCHLSPSV